MSIIRMGSSSMIAIAFEGKVLTLTQVAPPENGEWKFQDKTGELRWIMKGRETRLERGNSMLVRCETSLPVEIEMQPASVIPVLASLDRRVEQQQFMEVAADLYRVPALTPDVLAWLEGKAEAGIPPLQYELSRRIWSLDSSRALRWYARGYVARSLDFSQCSDKSRNPVYMSMLGLYASLRDLAIQMPRQYADALDEAIVWHERQTNLPGPKWICGDLLLPESQRNDARQMQLAEIREGITRLRAK